MKSEADYRIVRLANGTYSIRSMSHRETFHPVIGPAAEAQTLYVRQLRLPERVMRHNGEFVIWDVGFGAAANALTVLRALSGIRSSLRLISFDCTIEPIQFAVCHSSELRYVVGYEELLQQLITSKHVEFRNGQQSVVWELRLADFPALMRRVCCRGTGKPVRLPKPHAVLYDAYSPAKNPAMWTLRLFTDLFRALDADQPCALATYSRSTMLRVTLLLAGFYVGAGHATGEKEETTIAANKLELVPNPLGKEWLKRASRSTSAEPLRKPVYRQAPMAKSTLTRLLSHPQFAC